MVQQDMQEVNGGKRMYLAYYVHLFGIKEVTECKNARSVLLQNTD
jgi:hypothetical protein